MQKAFGKKRPAPRFDLKSVYIIKEWRPFSNEWALKEMISHEKGRPLPQPLPFLPSEEKEGRVGHPTLFPIV